MATPEGPSMSHPADFLPSTPRLVAPALTTSQTSEGTADFSNLPTPVDEEAPILHAKSAFIPHNQEKTRIAPSATDLRHDEIVSDLGSRGQEESEYGLSESTSHTPTPRIGYSNLLASTSGLRKRRQIKDVSDTYIPSPAQLDAERGDGSFAESTREGRRGQPNTKRRRIWDRHSSADLTEARHHNLSKALRRVDPPIHVREAMRYQEEELPEDVLRILYPTHERYVEDRFIRASNNPLLEVLKTVDGYSALIYSFRCVHFLLWSLVAGGAMILFPDQLDLIAFTSGYGFLPTSADPRQKHLILRSFAPHLVMTSLFAFIMFAWCIGRVLGSLLVIAVASRALWVRGTHQGESKAQRHRTDNRILWDILARDLEGREGERERDAPDVA